MRAIISVANRDGLTELARALQSQNVTIFSTSGTANALSTAGIEVELVSKLSGFREILEGRVKTLHPAIFADILAQRESDAYLQELQEHGMAPSDIVVVNLYPFDETVAHPDTTLNEAQEQIDIGGVSLIRAAAKNFQDVIVLVRSQDYAPVMQELREKGEVSFETRRRLAAIAFENTASYDTAIAEYLGAQATKPDYFPEDLTLSLLRSQPVRYGENPHQRAAVYRLIGTSAVSSYPAVADAEVLQRKELYDNNLLDLHCALSPD